MIDRRIVFEIFNEFTRRNEISISDFARNLILDLINCAERDRPEGWDVITTDFTRYYQRWVEVLPKLLGKMVSELKLTKNVSAMDAVYWIGRNTVIMGDYFFPDYCIFPGPDEYPDSPMSSLDPRRKPYPQMPPVWKITDGE